jgi:hypothetical protein
MSVKLLIALMVVLIAALVYVRRKDKVEESRPEPVKSSRSTTSSFHAVSISFDNYACPAAKEMAGRRFLSTAAPRLPLPDCSALQCNCKFKHHDDRRAGKDRRSPFSPAGLASAASGKHEQEQRQGTDRRKDTDPDDLFN